MRLIIIGMLLLLPLQAILSASGEAAQPSFDCSKARGWSELEVCRNDTLAGLDTRLASLYRERKAEADGIRQYNLIAGQRKWLSQRERCKYSATALQCLKDIYERRLAELSGAAAPGKEQSRSPIAEKSTPDRRTGEEESQERRVAEANPSPPRADSNPLTAAEAAETFDKGKAAFDNKDYTTSLQHFQTAAENGNAAAQRRLGEMYDSGVGVAVNKHKFVFWMRRSAEQNDLEAQLALASYLCGVRSAEAGIWYAKAAEQGSVKAQATLGLLYYFGLTCLKANKAEAAKWFRAASDSGNIGSMNLLADMYAKGEGVVQDQEQAAKLYRKALDHEHAGAAASLAALLATSNKEEERAEASQLYVKAIELYKKDVEKGDPGGWAAFALGNTYAQGIGVPPDLDEAKKWYKQAAERGYPGAKEALARHEAAERAKWAEAAAEYRRLKDAPVVERLRYMSDYDNLAVAAANLAIAQSPAPRTQAVIRIIAVNGEEAEADWPMRMHISGHVAGNITKPGWYVVHSYLSPDTEPGKRDGLPIASLSVSPVFACEGDACSSLTDLVAMVRLRNDLPEWQPN